MSADRRQNFRIRLPAEQQVAIIKIGSKSYAAEILDQSTDGFCIRCPRSTPIERGQQALLHGLVGKFFVEVMRRDEYDDWIELGVRTLWEGSASDEVVDTSYADRLLALLSSDKTPLIAGCGIVALVLLACVVARPFYGTKKKLEKGSLSRLTPSASDSATTFVSTSANPRAENVSPPNAGAAEDWNAREVVRANSSEQRGETRNGSTPSRSSALTSSLLILIGSPSTIEKLKLDPFQQAAITESVLAYRQALRQIDANKSMSAVDRQRASEESARATLFAIEGLLTPGQRETWNRIAKSAK